MIDIRKAFTVVFLTLILNITKGQIAGSFTIPGSFPSIAAAINTLNTLGVAGPVTINITAGYTETAPAGGYKLFNPIGGSVVNSVTFQKFGLGANPLITAFSGTANPASLVPDGVWWFIGADNFIIDGINIIDPNLTNPSTMEFGYGMYRASPGDGCQNNIIKNCVITLRSINSAASSLTSLIASGSRGIEIASTYTNNNTLTQTPTVSAGANSNNKFYSNTINNCHAGISLMGLGFPPNEDSNNDVGGTSAVTGNTVTNFGGGSGSETFGIRTNLQYSLNVSFNVLNNNNGTGLNPLTDLAAIHIGTAQTTSVTINSNTLSLFSSISSSTSLNGIINLAGNGSTVNVNNNVFSSYSYTSALANNFGLISNLGSGIINIQSNLIQNVNISPYSCSFISSGNGFTTAISSNTISNVNGLGGAVFFINTYDSYQTTISNNLITAVTFSLGYSGLTFLQSYNPGAGSITNNTVSNVYGGNVSGVKCIGGISYSITGNLLQNISSYPGNITGLDFTGFSIDQAPPNFASVTLSGNTIFSVTSVCSSSLANANLTGISFSAAIPAVISNNKIYSFTSNTAGSLHAVKLYFTDAIMSNNIIGDLNMSNSSQSVAISAVSIYTNTSIKMFYNSIYLSNLINSGINSGSSVLFISPSILGYTLNNNVFVNTSVPTGTGISSIMRRTDGILGGYGTSSNRNLFYVGTPSPSNIIYFDGTNSYSSLFSFKAAVATREAQSVSELVPFITTNGGAINTLDINPSIATQVESGGAAISGITTDYAGNLRNATTPDIGAWEGNYWQADITPPVIVSSGFTNPPCNFTNRTFTISLSDLSGVASGSLSPRLYYKINFGLYSSVQGSLTSGTFTSGVWTFNLSYSTSVGDIIYYFLVFQDQSYVNNLSVIPSNGASVMDVNNVFVTPVPANTYTIGTNPTIAVNNGTVCSGNNFTMTPTGAFTYSYSSNSAVVNPTTNSTYTVTGTSIEGCPSTNTVVSSVIVLPNPTISVNSGSICLGQSFTLNPTGAINYTYSSGSPVITPMISGFYTVVGSSSLGCKSNTVLSNVIVAISGIGASSTSFTICKGNTVSLNGIGGSGYIWSTGVTNNVPFTPTSTAIYTVTGTGSNGCIGSATIVVSVVPIPSVVAVASNYTICVGEACNLSGGGAMNYSWSPMGSIAPVVSVSPTITTTYTLDGKSNGCSNTTTLEVTVDFCTPVYEHEIIESISIYPNPNSGEFNIEMRSFSESTLIEVYNSIGQLILKIKPEELKVNIFMTKMPYGIYEVIIRNNDRVIALEKIIVE